MCASFRNSMLTDYQPDTVTHDQQRATLNTQIYIFLGLPTVQIFKRRE